MSAPSKAARELGQKLLQAGALFNVASAELVAIEVQSALADLLEKAEAMANHWTSGNNSELRKALEPWKAGE